jgi:uncharacterized membrane protein HdeD (DUF308 family)
MWKWNNGLSAQVNINKNIVENFKKYAKISGILFILLGLSGIIFPAVMSLSTLFFVSYLMIFTGLFSGWLTWKSNKEDWAGWLKSFILLLVGFLMVYNPVSGIATLGLLFSIYFFMDAFASFGLAFSTKPDKVWIIWLFNAITSLVLAIIFIIGWPFNSIYLVGLLVGISLLFDGITLLTGAFTINQVEDNK